MLCVISTEWNAEQNVKIERRKEHGTKEEKKKRDLKIAQQPVDLIVV